MPIRNGLQAGVIKMKKEDMGGLSIFLAIVMIGVVILTGLMVDIARLTSAKNQVARALDVSAVSVLAGYETDLMHEYGLYAINMPSPDPSALIYYMERNLGIDMDDGLFLGGLFTEKRDRPAKLYRYNIEDIQFNTTKPISDIDVLERQILEFMKYRGAAALASGVLDSILLAGTAAKMADSVKIKAEIDRKLAQIGKEQQDFRDYLYGDTGTTRTGEKHVRNFNMSNDRMRLAEDIADLYRQYVEVSQYHYEERTERSRSGEADANADRAERALVKDAKNDLQRAINELQDKYTRPFLESNRNAANCIEKIKQYTNEIEILYEKLGESILNFDEKDLETPFIDPFLLNIEQGKESLIDAQSAQEKQDALNGNITAITQAVSSINEISRELLNYSPPAAPVRQTVVIDKLMQDISSYNRDVIYDFQRTPRLQGLPDPREYVGDRVKELFGNNNEDKKLSDIGIDAKYLPSRNQTRRPDEQTVSSDTGETAEPGYIDDSGHTEGFFGMSENGDIGYSTFGDNGDFTRNSLDGVSDLKTIQPYYRGNTEGAEGGTGGGSGSIPEKVMNMYYVNEYALSMFNNNAKDKYRWAGVMPPEKTAYFDAEVEYILHGNDTQSKNMFWTKCQLLATRFAMNFIHIHSDEEKIELARYIAIAIVGLFSAMTLVPLATGIVISAWSIAEAIIDVHDLMDGKGVPFIKMKGDWKTTIGTPNIENPLKTDDNKKWTYIDYLRIYLAMTPRDKKLARINDLIVINTTHAGRELLPKNLYCEVENQIAVSVNYLFMTASFMPEPYKAPQNRHMLYANSKKDLF